MSVEPSLERGTAPDPYDILPARPSFELRSDDLTDGQPMDKRFAHGSVGGDNISPNLRWFGFPAETQSFVVTCFDPDAPTGSGFWHWVLVGLPAGTVELPTGAGAAGADLPGGAFHVRNDYGEAEFGGAAPPAGDVPHRYVFTVHAVDTVLDLPRSASPAYVGFNLAFHTLARAVLRATYRVE
jgi:Raf kinase inhibitor-like YbhB/YbcL family protein